MCDVWEVLPEAVRASNKRVNDWEQLCYWVGLESQAVLLDRYRAHTYLQLLKMQKDALMDGHIFLDDELCRVIQLRKDYL